MLGVVSIQTGVFGRIPAVPQAGDQPWCGEAYLLGAYLVMSQAASGYSMSIVRDGEDEDRSGQTGLPTAATLGRPVGDNFQLPQSMLVG